MPPADQIEGSPVTLNHSQLGLNLLLLDSGICDLLQLLPVPQDVALQEVLQLEHVLRQLELVTCKRAEGSSIDAGLSNQGHI